MGSEIIKRGTLLEGNELDIEYRNRKKTQLEDTIDKKLPIPEGWTLKKEFKSTPRKRIVKQKDIDVELEDKVWRLFYELGIKKLSSRDFRIVLKKRNGIDKTKEIDVLSIDDDIIFIVECKSQGKNSKKILKKDIAEFSDNMDDIRNSIKSLLKVNKLQFVFIFATENIIWDENDKLDAKEKHILIWDEYDLLSLEYLANLAGEGAKYQIYNRIFYGKEIKNFEIAIPALKSEMGGHTYYSFIMAPEHLLKIAYVHHRSGQFSFLELAGSYQRMINKSRIRKIEQFIKDGGFFPGSVIVNFKRKLKKEDILGDKQLRDKIDRKTKPVIITLPPYYGCAWIIDGQHRLYGYADIKQKQTETLPVVAFVGESDHIQAKVFTDINKNQKSIEADLLWDLYEDLYPESQEEKEQQLYTISKIAKKLNSMIGSPFQRNISIPKEQNRGNISLTTVCTSISQQKLISKSEGLLFNKTYKDTILYAAERISCFFDVIQKELSDEWNAGDNHYVRTNAGFVVLIGILRDIVECNLAPDEKVNIVRFRKVIEKFLQPLLLHFFDVDDNMIRSYRGAGGAGQKSRQVRYELTKVIRDAKVGFRSRWLEKYEEALKKEDKFAKKRKGIQYYLDKDESELIEFKASLLLDVNRYLKGDGKIEESEDILNEGVLKTIVGFLNTKGGEIIVGILEKSRFETEHEEKLIDCPIYNDKIIFGISNEYKKDEWDGFQRRLLAYIETRIAPEVIDMDLVKIEKLTYEDKELCLITISPAEAKQYLENKLFIRRGNKTVLLEGSEIDKYWSSRLR
jgi:DNA sulfur modification protein DndB